MIVHELVHILGKRELNILFYCRMNITVNVVILVSVNGTLSQFNFVVRKQTHFWFWFGFRFNGIYKMPKKTPQKLYFATILDLEHKLIPLGEMHISENKHLGLFSGQVCRCP